MFKQLFALVALFTLSQCKRASVKYYENDELKVQVVQPANGVTLRSVRVSRFNEKTILDETIELWGDINKTEFVRHAPLRKNDEIVITFSDFWTWDSATRWKSETHKFGEDFG